MLNFTSIEVTNKLCWNNILHLCHFELPRSFEQFVAQPGFRTECSSFCPQTFFSFGRVRPDSGIHQWTWWSTWLHQQIGIQLKHTYQYVLGRGDLWLCHAKVWVPWIFLERNKTIILCPCVQINLQVHEHISFETRSTNLLHWHMISIHAIAVGTLCLRSLLFFVDSVYWLRTGTLAEVLRGHIHYSIQWYSLHSQMLLNHLLGPL